MEFGILGPLDPKQVVRGHPEHWAAVYSVRWLDEVDT